MVKNGGGGIKSFSMNGGGGSRLPLSFFDQNKMEDALDFSSFFSKGSRKKRIFYGQAEVRG